MLKNLPTKLKCRLFVLTVATACFFNCALAVEVSRSQGLTNPISIDIEKKTLKETLDQIAKQGQIGIIYSNAKGILNKQVTIHAKDQPVSKVLTELLSPLKLTYEIIGDQIVVSSSRPPTQGQSEKPAFPIKGKVTDSKGIPFPGATIKIKGGSVSATTDSKGEFEINNVADSTVLQVSFIGYLTKEIVVTSAEYLTIVLENGGTQLNEVAIVSTGYQTIPKERATGSFVQIDNQLINRSVSTNILDRLNGVTSGLIFTNNGNHQFGQSNIEIRGRATLFSNPDPLIIVDNFPYDGDVNNINPNDIESITILKDAAAASAWGARSGNGVIVITTKKGHLNAAPTVSFNANATIGAKPNLYYTPQLTSAQYIGIEHFLFNQGAYNASISDGYSALSPAVEIFSAKRNGTISAADSLARINKLKGYDSRQQILKYYYRPSVFQQYQASISGGGAAQKYFVSAGYDKNLNSYVNNSYDRVSLNASNTYYFLKNKLEFFSNIIYTASTTKSGPVVSNTLYPYDQFADANGNPLAIAKTLRLSYASTAGNGQLLNWLYKPLDELNNGYSGTTTNLTDYRINLSLTYKIFPGLKALALYNYEKGVTESDNLNERQSYYTRNLINTYTQIDPVTGTVTHPIPLGDILYTNLTNISSNNGRFQLNYDSAWGKHAISAIAGTEIKDYTTFNSTNGLYGYNPETATNQNAAVNYTAYYPNFYGYNTSQIPTNTTGLGTDNRFFSYYFNGSYIYNDKYIASLSARRDESNLFGVTTNQKGVPLWSAGLAWVVNKEIFYKIDWLPQLKLRATYGYTGNVNTNLSAYLTASPGLTSKTYNAPYSQIVNPPNPSLRWEKDRNINIGLDFATKENRLTGSVDYWHKNGIDLIGNSPIAPQTGTTLYTGNSANTSTKGVDVQLNSINLNGKLKWLTTLLYNHVQSRVTDYKVSNGTNYNVVSANYNNPLQGYPYYAIFSFKYAGLTATGDPQGYLNGTVSSDYTGIANSTNRSELVYSGSATPTSFGSLRNTFAYNAFDLSFNITYKFGYHFRRNSLNNDGLYSTGGGNYQMSDYDNRWQKPGDELHTNVPALIYPSSTYRTALYTYSNILVENAANIRLQDFRLGYTLSKKPHLPFRNLNVFAYINNIGILWRANKYHIDPDYPTGILVPRTIAFGIKGDL
ncbi:SusC/RagA family TonB-linked outer membrane protein [Mucilaginibacter paludis]|uniref:TonB-dependent receptor plug n=1 Tax=Mucilaginibacter paludis DSM 18603 TaxID=714943 RepID=H1YI06_9SPHI|nr:SusC/RagA family TonB-linked outer membrane protein [Mucilaginibacter paludis]EHQ25554.1 TonB-dependent receptor plug [Mucilaginibacter paludis DSM 18603]